MDNKSYIQSLLESDSLRKSILREMVKSLNLPVGSHGLDAGCGIGLQCLLLAEETGPAGHVTGLDISEEMLDYGLEIVKDAGLSERIDFKKGDISGLPFDDKSFDWAWSSDCAGYAPFQPIPKLKEMKRVVKPGGIVAIAAWSSEKLLPGYPRLEARLGATTAGIAPFIQGKDPELHFMRALGWFREIGLKEYGVKVFVDSVSAPLSNEVRNFLEALFEMRWPDVSSELSSEDLAEFNRLCKPDSPDFILDHPDYCAYFTYTLFWGRK
jgi:ubiquinone/menaquinone biosynthesis C-methylase UbiE